MGGVVAELAILAAPLWIAALVGLLLGWAWRPRWATGIAAGGEKAADSVVACSPPSDGLGRPSLDQPMASLLSCSGGSSVPQQPDGEKSAVTEKDLQHLCQLVEMTDGGPAWRKMMEKSLPNMSYQAWQRDPQVDHLTCLHTIIHNCICHSLILHLLVIGVLMCHVSCKHFADRPSSVS